MALKSPLQEKLRIAALVLLTILIWCFVEHRWTAAAWQTPVEYTADRGALDVTALFAGIKAARDGYFIPFASKINPDLGAPYVGNWNDYPTNEQFQVFLYGLLAANVGVFAAANLALLTAQVLAALCFYLVVRSLKCGWPWAFVGALAFAFAPFAFAQGLHHLTITNYWHIPLCLLVCRWAATGLGMDWRDRRFKIALFVAFLAGIQNIYYAAMFVQLLGLGCVIQLARRRWKAIFTSVAIGTMTVFTFLLMNASTFIYHAQFGPNTGAVKREYYEIEITAMKFIAFFMPWQHRIPAFQDWSHGHFAGAWVRGENPPSAYFGLLGIVALVWVTWATVRYFTTRPVKPLPIEVLQGGWIFLYSIVGGVNGLLGSFGFVLLRATTRYSILILCLLLIFLVRRLSLLTARWRPATTAALAAAVLLVVLWDQLPPVKTEADLRATAALVDSDRAFAVEMEKRLPQQAMVFQVPVMDFPENFGSNLPSYDHFRPYLYTSDLRYSFGSDKGRPRADWQHQLAGLSFPDLIGTLERYGFAAIYGNRKGLKDAQGFIDNLRAMGRTEMIASKDGELFCVLLHPVPEKERVLPLGGATK